MQIINAIQHVRRIRDKNNTIIDTRKKNDKIQHPFIIKALKKLGM
jgi:hypothetical protein